MHANVGILLRSRLQYELQFDIGRGWCAVLTRCRNCKLQRVKNSEETRSRRLSGSCLRDNERAQSTTRWRNDVASHWRCKRQTNHI